MSNGQLSFLNDHSSINLLSDGRSSKLIRLQLQYNDQREGLEKLIKGQFSPTVTIRDVIKDFLKFVHLDSIRPEDVILNAYIHDRRYRVPVKNAHMTLDELNIVDGCTLCFEPLLKSAAEGSSYLTIWAPNSAGKVEYKWHKTTTTLGMLLEHVIQIFSLELIERERIHLFYDFEEIDLALNYDKLLKELRIRDEAFIDVEIIPPISYPISFTNISTSDEHLLSVNDSSSTTHAPNVKSNQYISLVLQYLDRTENLQTVIEAQFSPKSTIQDVIKEFFKRAHLHQILPQDVNLIGFSLDKHYHVLEGNTNKTLEELKIVDGCILYLQSSPSSTLPKTSKLKIWAPDGVENVVYKWDQATTTLKMLLEHIIKIFSLESTEHELILLSTRRDVKLDHASHSDKLLSQLGIMDGAWIYVKITPSRSSNVHAGNMTVLVECGYFNGKLFLDIPVTNTIDELKYIIEKRFEGRLLIDFNLSDAMNKEIDISNPKQTLQSLGIKPGQTIYATLRLAFANNQSSTLNTRSETTTRSSSLITKHQPDEVLVVYEFSTFESVNTKASVNDTVAELIRKVEALKKSRPLAQFQIWSLATDISTDQPSRRLSSFGIKPGDIINVRMIENTPVFYTNNSSQFTTSYMFGEPSKTQRCNSRPVGLSNLGNTCYMNSALQCLAHVNPLTQFFLDGFTQGTSDDDKGIDPEWNQFYTIGTVTGAYADVLRNLWLSNKTSYYSSSFLPTHIKETIGLQAPRFATYDQQDAQEFMTFLLDEIHKELKEKNGSESNTIVEELFFGKIQSIITCLECKHQVKTTNPISFLPLPLNQPGRIFQITFIAKNGDNDFGNVSVSEDGKVKDLIQAFAESRPSYYFFRTIIVIADDGQLELEMPLNRLSTKEIMLVEQDDFTRSSQVDRFSRHSKKLTLTGCLREFCSVECLEDSWLCQQETCKKHTKATKQLQLGSLPPILIIQFKRFSHEDGSRQKIETFVDYPIDGLNLSSFLASEEEAIYDLFAVCNHTGSIYGGHYIAYARQGTNSKSEWHKFDDSYISSFCLDSDIVSKYAYLLFYIKRNKPKQSTAATTS